MHYSCYIPGRKGFFNSCYLISWCCDVFCVLCALPSRRQWHHVLQNYLPVITIKLRWHNLYCKNCYINKKNCAKTARWIKDGCSVESVWVRSVDAAVTAADVYLDTCRNSRYSDALTLHKRLSFKYKSAENEAVKVSGQYLVFLPSSLFIIFQDVVSDVLLWVNQQLFGQSFFISPFHPHNEQQHKDYRERKSY